MSDGGSPGFAESEEALHEAAAEIVGSDDFGDPSYLEGLRVLLDAYDQEARLNDTGRMLARQTVQDVLVRRLRCEKQWRDHPETLHHAIERPIVICGLVRTGSTALHYLMGQDPDLQVLPYWLAESPQPRPPRADWAGHPDFLRAKAEIDGMYAADPSLRAIHFMMPDGPEECRHLLMQEFTDDSFEANAHIPSYSAWYQQADMLRSYERHRDLIKLIGSTDTRRTWLLKYPVHMRFLRTFLEVYPDACIVQTHRDPLVVLPSYVSLIAGFRAIHEHGIDRPAIARRQLELWAAGADDAIELRRKRDSGRFYDLHFADFMADPVAAVRRIHAHFGRELSEAGERALRAWQADNPQHKHGQHEYSAAPEDVGLTRSEILDRFADYIDYFGIATKS